MADAATEKPTETCEVAKNGTEEKSADSAHCATTTDPSKLKEQLSTSPQKHRLDEEDKPDKDADYPCNGKDSSHDAKRLRTEAAEGEKDVVTVEDEDDENDGEDDDEGDDEDGDFGDDGEDEEGEEAE